MGGNGNQFFSNPIPSKSLRPLSPFPLVRGRGNGYKREALPLFDSPLILANLKERHKIAEEGLTPLLSTTFILYPAYFRLIRYSFSKIKAASAALSLFCSRSP